jgi:hypothetical protein
MPLSWNEIKDRALNFSHEWADAWLRIRRRSRKAASEDAEAKSYVFIKLLEGEFVLSAFLEVIEAEAGEVGNEGLDL